MTPFKGFLAAIAGLRGRLSVGMILMTLAACIAFALAVHDFVDVLQDKILQRTLDRELKTLSVGYHYGVPITQALGDVGRIYISRRPDEDPALPAELRHVRPGRHYTFHIDGHTYYTGRRNVDDAAIYLMINVDDVANLEDRLAMLGWSTLAATILLALLIALGFTWAILRPVRHLAERLSHYRPGQSNRPIAADYGDRDVRDIAESFDALIQRFNEAIAREQAFTEDASHELRTPLSVALNASELLSNMGGFNPLAQRRVARVRDACERMQRLVNALLFLARDQCGTRENLSDAATVLDSVLMYQHDAIEARGIELAVDAKPTPVPLPEGVVYSVLYNLIENAIRHTENGRLEVNIAEDRISVRDTGQGMPPATLKHIFERRYRTANSPGLGLGLYLVSRICDRQGWPIDVSSQLGQGTTIEIKLRDQSRTT